MAFNANKLTEKAQEAIVTAQRLAEERQHTLLEPEHLLAALIGQEGGVVPAVLEKLGVQPRALLQQANAAVGALPRMTTPPAQVHVSNEFLRLLEAPRPRPSGSRTTTPPPSTSCWPSPTTSPRGKAGQILRGGWRHPRQGLPGAAAGPRRPARHLPEPRDHLPVAGAVRPRPDRARPRPASSTRSSAATRRSAGSSRSSPAGPRTTRS